MQVQSRLTAIARKSLSAPSRYLLENGFLKGRILDFGCGRGDLKKFVDGDIEEYDPFYAPHKPIGKFDVVVCNYVLCVLDWRRRMKALEEARSYLKPGGCLFVSVRRDLKRSGPTSKGFQFNVRLKEDSLVRRSGAFEIYKIKNDEGTQCVRQSGKICL
jgi:SAM-dependent methyltransferase